MSACLPDFPEQKDVNPNAVEVQINNSVSLCGKMIHGSDCFSKLTQYDYFSKLTKSDYFSKLTQSDYFRNRPKVTTFETDLIVTAFVETGPILTTSSQLNKVVTFSTKVAT
ncbi:hypothetical protein AVEN_228399-1 [Araneus ventricosus]|uniref:Uncharacterized protein n=1 Tax=Araneus ventricosus TaxID=182803 RepID=A0A4Y2V4G6_ARAVE|nr:hypothetical protein AVEN_228399-1 [Araneus ventricosus]